MKRSKASIQGAVVLALLPVAVSTAISQADMTGTVEIRPTFFFDAMSYASDQANKSRIDFYVQVPYEELRFVKEGDHYLARYDVVLNVATTDQKILQERSWTVEVKLRDFSQTVSDKLYSLTQRAIDIEPGTYHVTAQVKDHDSQKTSRIQRAMLVTDYSRDSLSLSDVMLVSRLTTDGEKKTIVPNISGNVGTLGEGFFLFFEVYNEVPSDSVEFFWKIYNNKEEKVSEASQTHPSTGTRMQTFLAVKNLKLPVGTYRVMVEAQPVGAKTAERPHANTSREFKVQWTDIPATITDLEKAVEQLRYIAQPSEYDYLRGAESDDERKRRFLEFWLRRDPDRSTPRNELMEEYYRRVQYANENFSHYMEGWRTDMGMVYIRFGPPDNVERHPFDMNSKPYEVWYYYQIERQFIFVDETGFGDYRLRYPTTDLWGRIR